VNKKTIMSSNKRRRTDEEQVSPAVSAPTSPVSKLRLPDELACKLGRRHCTEAELVNLMISASVCSKVVVNTISPQLSSGGLKLCRLTQIKLGPLLQPHFEMLETIFEWQVVQLFLANGIVTRVTTLEVKATLMGDLNEWMTITLDSEHASTADVKEGVEQAKGLRPAIQELFRYDESWTGTEGSGGSGHSVAQEEAALVEEGFVFEGPCSLMVSVNESYAVVLEGQEEGELLHDLMGVYERMEGKEINGRGVWQAAGGIDFFLCYFSTARGTGKWLITDRRGTDKNGPHDHRWQPLSVESAATTPDQTTELWMAYYGTASGWQAAPKLRVRVCSSVEKHAAEQRVVQAHKQALVQAQQSRQLVHPAISAGRARQLVLEEQSRVQRKSSGA
jgi:hypothetical protein